MRMASEVLADKAFRRFTCPNTGKVPVTLSSAYQFVLTHKRG